MTFSGEQGTAVVKRLCVAIVLLLTTLMLACGGGSTAVTSGYASRAFVSNATGISGVATGEVQIVNTANDFVASNFMTVAAQPSVMAVSSDHTITVVYSQVNNAVTVITNSSESSTGSLGLPNFTDSLVLRDSIIGYAALRNSNAVAVLNLSNTSTPTVASYLPVTLARRLVLSPNRTKLLVFSDNSETVNVIDTATSSLQGTITMTGNGSGTNRPAFGVFLNESTAFIMNCGVECGGTAAATLQVITIPTSSTGALSLVPGYVSVDAASVGFLNGNNLYVAGTANGTPGQGFLNVFDVSSGTPVATAVQHVPIGDGYHTQMVLGANSKLFIGAMSCSDNCLSIFDSSANSVTRAPNQGSVTSMAPVSGRGVVYVVEGGALHEYSTTSNLQTASIFIPGQAYSVVLVDQ